MAPLIRDAALCTHIWGLCVCGCVWVQEVIFHTCSPEGAAELRPENVFHILEIEQRSEQETLTRCRNRP